MTYIVDRIGALSVVTEGKDEYLAVRDSEGAIDPEALEQWALQHYYDAGSGPGQYYCHTVRVLMDPIHDNRAILIVCHRYDV